MCVCACSTARGTGERVTSKPWKPLFGNSAHPSLQPLVVSGTLQLCHNHSSWKHLSLWSGAELHFYPHKCFAGVLPTAIPGCHEAFGVCPSCWCLQSLVTLGTAAMSWFDPGPISSPSLPRLFTREAVKPELCSGTWPGITRCTREPLCCASMAALLFVGNLFASSLSHRGLNTSLVCSAGAFPHRDGVCVVCLCPVRVCPHGFS